MIEEPGNSRYCEIRLKRARDLTDRDVIRLAAGQIVRVEGEMETAPGHVTLHPQNRGKITGPWREVLDVYDSMEPLQAQFGELTAEYRKPLRELAEFAFDRTDECYVLVRLLIHERSRDELDDVFAVLYRHDLAETQSLPVWESPPAPDRAREFVRAVAQNRIARRLLRRQGRFNEVVRTARALAGELGIDYEPGEGHNGEEA
jgi:hypothetical protein